MIKDRLSTRELLRRKNLTLQYYSCAICISAQDESLLHLFLDCQFANLCWSWLNLQVNPTLDPFQIVESFRDQLRVPFFLEIIILMCWAIWKTRNDLIFRHIGPNLERTKVFFKEELQWLSMRLKVEQQERLNQWVASLL